MTSSQGRSRRSRRANPPPAKGPSRFEIGAYGVLGGLVAAAVLIAGGRPWWQAAVVLGGAIVLVGLLIAFGPITSRRGRRRRH